MSELTKEERKELIRRRIRGILNADDYQHIVEETSNNRLKSDEKQRIDKSDRVSENNDSVEDS